ncbi:DUF3800 domain-containing protein [Staphylococcus hyicus]|uniref:DUF3800 domain-containing protein n=1 Tax=Staphylococcus hyicus TaxID=1284 RepID=UPI00208F3DEA|nr:DUF3800 domain-containing protein [Staphylococcus hyicus]MCO4332501.1 DUF3800 domain-containing protein [Staphylococcus hyicus]MCO4334901.1 DUF3800 domain-containing protein [Staphylococcus hyicus]
MKIFVYSDESGVFDFKHEEHFVFGGLIFLDKDSVNKENRKYINVEKTFKSNNWGYKNQELKASKLPNDIKGKFFRSLNNCIKFGVIIELKKIRSDIFLHKKSKQRYLDYAFKIGLKRVLEELISQAQFNKDEVEAIFVNCDEHSTATDGKYELREGLEQEFKYGTYNYNFNTFFPPLFSSIKEVNLSYCNSSKKPLIRAADIVANRIYFHIKKGELESLKSKIHITVLP